VKTGDRPHFPEDRKWGLSPVFPFFFAFLAGAATVLAYSPFDLLPVGVLAFALLVHLWVGAGSPRAAFLLGFWFGLGLFGAGVSWVYVSLHQFGGMPAPLAVVATLGFCAVLALYPALAGWLQARVAASDFVRATLVIPAAWIFTEWLRGWFLTGFPWLALGYASAGWPYAGFAPVLGVYGVSLAIAALSGCAWCFVRGPGRGAALAALLLVSAVGEALRHVAWTTPSGTVGASLLQGNIPQQMKFSPELYARTLDTYARLAGESRAPLVILPETAVPRLLDQVEPDFLRRLEDIARRNRGDLLLGAPVRTAPRVYFNAVVSLGTSPRQIYRKVHLVPFGEFAPPGFGWVMRTLSIPLADFSRGEASQRPLAVAGARVAANVCYEDAYGEDIARQLPEADLLVNVSNVAWFGDSLAPAQHLQVARLRALETGRAYLTATNTGITAAIDRDGRVIAQLPQFTEGRLDVTAPRYSGATPYVRYGDLGALGACALLLAIALVFTPRAPSG